MPNDFLGLYAESRAGHDRGSLYIIIGEEGEYVWVADGQSRTLARPKRKNKKHLQVMKAKVNEEIKRALKGLKCQNQI
jgi:ribosomal protein L14E/L6E/L27E